MNPQNSPSPSAPAGSSGSGGNGSTATSATPSLAQTARDAASQIKSAASDTVARAKDEASRVVSEKKESTANRVEGYGSAIHASAKSLEEQDPNIAWFTHRAADKLQGVADYMRRRDLPGLRRDAEGIARRHPAAFFGGMFLAGLILGNVVKASRPTTGANRHDDTAPNDADRAQPEDAAPPAPSEPAHASAET